MSHSKFRAATTLGVACLLAACQSQPSPDLLASTAPIADDALCLVVDATSEAADGELHSSIERVRLRPEDASLWIAVGRNWLERVHARSDSGDVLQVAACARAAQARAPDMIAALELHASVQLNAHEFRAALALAERVLQQSPEDINSWGIKSDALLELGEFSAAAAAAKRQMQLWPGASAQARAAYLHWLHGDVEAAKRSLINALRGRDERTPVFNAWLWQEVAKLYLHEGDAVAAEALYARSLDSLPGYAPALLGRARAALVRGEPAAARQWAMQAQQAGSGIDAAIVLGDAYTALGQTAAAQAAFMQAEEVGRRGDTLGLARFLSERRRDPARALKLLLPLTRQRGGLDLGDALAWAQFRTGHCSAAAKTLRPLLDLGTRDARLLLHGGAIELECGDAQRGRRLFQIAQILDPGSDPVALQELRARLAQAPQT